MAGLFSPQAFAGFGPDALGLAGGEPHLARVQASRPSGLRSAVRLDCPRRPGIYGMIDARGELIYVGKAQCLRSRLLSYFRPKSRDPKAGDIIRETRLIAWEVLPTELAALLRELDLIQRWQPRFNVQGQPRRRRPAWVCLGRQPAPHAFVSYRVPSTAHAAFGPVPGGGRAREAVRRFNDLFRLRDCPQPQTMTFADQQELFPVIRTAGCIRLEIDTCLGPCAAACTHSEYLSRVQSARAFLEGSDTSALQQIEQEMTAASAALQFERAAALRDRLDPLSWLQEHLQRLRQARQVTMVYPLQGHDGRHWWYVLVRGQVRLVVPAPSARTEGETIAARLQKLAFLDKRVVEFTPGVLLVAAWFRKRPAELSRGVSLEQALRICEGSPPAPA